MTDDRIRLQKYLSMCAVASRRKAEELIAQGKVKVNGKVAQIGDKISPKHDTVTVSGRKIVGSRKHYYIMLHKPRGYITTMDDEMGRKCVAELVRDVGARVYPVGRLDKDSEGLLLMTNDGEFANHMTHPSKHIPKTYRVTVRPDVTEDMLTAFATGMEIDGRITAPADAHIIEKQDNRVVMEIVLYEGRNRQIRKMCESLGLEVARLKRTSMGSLKLGMLPQGKWRELKEDEVHKLMVSSGMKVNKF
ncbi:MAG TPA: rRNA pseudouridine synthase [Oscillospiraceae bacterium]|nr:rRNA pseudouridine synthase [Oscillospiraceae bacterium]